MQTFVRQDGEQMRKGNNTYGNAELSFEIDTLNLLTGSVNFYKGNNVNQLNQLLRQTSSDGGLQQQYQQQNDGMADYHGTDLALNYEKGFRRNKEHLLTTSYKYSQLGSDRDNEGDFFNRVNFALPDYQQYNQSGTKEHAAQLDYVHPVKILNIEAGVKVNFWQQLQPFCYRLL